MTSPPEDAVWKALADPTRREIIEFLRQQPTTTGELAARFAPRLVRTAVMKHLDVLEHAGLLRVERIGRSRWNHLEPRALAGMATWLKRRTLTHCGNLQRLKHLAEQ